MRSARDRGGLTCLLLALLLGWAVASRAAAAPPSPSPISTPDGSGAPQTGPAQELPADLQAQLQAMQDIRDIRPPVGYGADPRWWIAGAAAALLALVAALLAWLRHRRRRAATARTATEPPPVPADETARQALAALRAEAHLDDKAFYFRLCEVVRRYLDGRFGADTLEKTTEELVGALRALPLAAQQRTDLVGLFRHADPVRYADLAAAPERRSRDLDLAEALVTETCSPGEDGRVPLR